MNDFYTEREHELLSENGLSDLETRTYESLLEIRELTEKMEGHNVPYEKIQKINELIAVEEQKIHTMSYMKEIGYDFTEEENYIDIVRSRAGRKSENRALVLGILLSPFAYLGLFEIITALMGNNPMNIDFIFFITLSINFILGGLGIMLIAKAVERRKKFRFFRLNVGSEDIIFSESRNSTLTYSKSECKFYYEIKDLIHYIKLKSDSDEHLLFEMSFDNILYTNTLELLIEKLNNK